MQVVINIDNRLYENVIYHTLTTNEIEEICNVVRDGVVLPKGHGELIDRNESLRTDYFNDGHDGLRAFHEYSDYKKMRNYLESLPTIIEADKEE